VSFRRPKKPEFCDIVDVMGVLTDTLKSNHENVRMGDLFEIILVQMKGGSAKMPSGTEIQRSERVRDPTTAPMTAPRPPRPTSVMTALASAVKQHHPPSSPLAYPTNAPEVTPTSAPIPAPRQVCRLRPVLTSSRVTSARAAASVLVGARKRGGCLPVARWARRSRSGCRCNR